MKKSEAHLNQSQLKIMKVISKGLYAFSIILFVNALSREKMFIYLLFTLVAASLFGSGTELFGAKRRIVFGAHSVILGISILAIWFFFKTGVVLTTIYY